MADNFDEFDDDRDEVEAAEEDALYLAEEVNTDDEGDDDAELASASSTLDEEEDVEDADEDGNEPGFISEEERARSLMVDMPNPHGSIIEGANGGEGTIVRAAFLGKEMQTSFLEYSMSVIVSRALPDVRDGLKPVHRRILYAMNESGYTPNKPHMKSARTVGDVIGKYHPHGDFAVYDTMVRLAQPFGPGIPKSDGRLFAMCARNALAGEDIVLKTTGASTRMYLYTADAVSALLTVMLKGEPGCAYNAANPSTYCSVREMAEMVASLAPDGSVQVRCAIDPDAPYPPEHHLPLDVSRLQALGWAATQDLPGMYRNLMAYLED